MQKRERSGAVINPARVVAPINVKCPNWNGWIRAPGPCPIIRSTRKSSIAGYSTSSTAGCSRCISSIKKTSLPSSEVSIAVKSPLRSSSGPALVLIGTFNSLAIICARVVLPSPGGPYSSTWSSASPRLLAASMAIWIFSLTRFWPIYSSSRFGRTLTSMRASSSYACPDTIRSGCLCCIIRFAVPSAIGLSRTPDGHDVSCPYKALTLPTFLILRFAPSVQSMTAAPRAAISQNFPCPPRAWLLPPRLPPFARRIPDSPARKSHPPRRPRAKPPTAFRPLWPQSPACPSIPPPCAPRFFFRRREFSSGAPDRSRESPAPVLPHSSRSEFSAPASAPRRKRKAASRKNVFPAPTQTRTAPAHLPAHGYGSRESLRCAARRARRTSKAGPARGTRRRPRPRALGSVFFRRAVREAGQSSLASIAAFPSPVNAKQGIAHPPSQRRRSRCSGRGFRRLILPGNGAHRDGQAVPHINGGRENGKVHDLFFAEVSLHFFVDGVGDVRLGNKGHGFDPRQRGAFPVGVKRGFAPGIQLIEALFGLPERAGVFRMHVNAISAAVDLRSAQLQQVEQLVFEAARGKIFFQPIHSSLGFGSKFQVVNPGLHRGSPFCVKNSARADFPCN